jgi:hypothetical protein
MNMMKLQIKLFCLLLVMATASCEKDVAGYSDEPRVYFFERNNDLTQSRISYKSYTFLLLPAEITKDTFYVRVKVMGNTSATNRIIRGRAIATGTTAKAGQHYEFIDGAVPADSLFGYLPVVLRRTEDIKDTAVTLVLGIAETKDFKPGVGEDSAFTLSWSDNVVKPDNWDGIISIGSYFGAYSAAKWRFIISVTGRDKFPLQQSGRIPPKEGEYTHAGMQDIQAIVKAALKAYNDTHDPDLTDENGQLVTFP